MEISFYRPIRFDGSSLMLHFLSTFLPNEEPEAFQTVNRKEGFIEVHSIAELRAIYRVVEQWMKSAAIGSQLRKDTVACHKAILQRCKDEGIRLTPERSHPRDLKKEVQV